MKHRNFEDNQEPKIIWPNYERNPYIID